MREKVEGARDWAVERKYTRILTSQLQFTANKGKQGPELVEKD